MGQSQSSAASTLAAPTRATISVAPEPSTTDSLWRRISVMCRSDDATEATPRACATPPSSATLPRHSLRVSAASVGTPALAAMSPPALTPPQPPTPADFSGEVTSAGPPVRVLAYGDVSQPPSRYASGFHGGDSGDCGGYRHGAANLRACYGPATAPAALGGSSCGSLRLRTDTDTTAGTTVANTTANTAADTAADAAVGAYADAEADADADAEGDAGLFTPPALNAVAAALAASASASGARPSGGGGHGSYGGGYGAEDCDCDCDCDWSSSPCSPAAVSARAARLHAALRAGAGARGRARRAQRRWQQRSARAQRSLPALPVSLDTPASPLASPGGVMSPTAAVAAALMSPPPQQPAS